MERKIVTITTESGLRFHIAMTPTQYKNFELYMKQGMSKEEAAMKAGEERE